MKPALLLTFMLVRLLFVLIMKVILKKPYILFAGKTLQRYFEDLQAILKADVPEMQNVSFFGGSVFLVGG